MAIKRKKSRHKKKLRTSLRNTLFIVFGFCIIFSIGKIIANSVLAKSEEIEKVIYKSTSTFKQENQVSLKKNKYMNVKDIQDKQSFVTDLIDNIETKINYKYEGDTAKKINVTYKIKGILKSNYSSNGKEEEFWNKEYILLNEKEKSTNEKYIEINEKIDIDINEEFEHKIDFLTKEDIDYLENEKLCFKIYASEQIEKKGKTPIEEILKNIKEDDDLKQKPTNNNNGIKNKEMSEWNIVSKDDVGKKIQNNNQNNLNNNTNNANGNINNRKGKKRGCNIF